MAPQRIASTFRENSTDAVLARIMANQDNQDRATIAHRTEIKAELQIFHQDLNVKMDAIKDGVDRAASKEDVISLSKRVNDLEQDKWIKTGRSAVFLMLLGVLSWFLPWYFTRTSN